MSAKKKNQQIFTVYQSSSNTFCCCFPPMPRTVSSSESYPNAVHRLQIFSVFPQHQESLYCKTMKFLWEKEKKKKIKEATPKYLKCATVFKSEPVQIPRELIELF